MPRFKALAVYLRVNLFSTRSLPQDQGAGSLSHSQPLQYPFSTPGSRRWLSTSQSTSSVPVLYPRFKALDVYLIVNIFSTRSLPQVRGTGSLPHWVQTQPPGMGRKIPHMRSPQCCDRHLYNVFYKLLPRGRIPRLRITGIITHVTFEHSRKVLLKIFY